MRGYNELLLEGNLQGDDRTCVEAIEVSVRQMQDYVEQLLDMTRGGDMEMPVKTAVRADTFLEDIRKKAQGLTSEKQAVLIWEAAVPEGTIRADRQRLERALLNILANSAEYAGCGGRVSCAQRSVRRRCVLQWRTAGRVYKRSAAERERRILYRQQRQKRGKAFGAGAVHCRQNYRRAWGKTGAGKFGSPWGRACVCLAAALTIE